jgi:hypothetical protein
VIQNLIYASIPLIYQYIREEEEWCIERKRIYWTLFFGVFVTRLFNWLLVRAQGIYIEQKLIAKKMILSMIDPQYSRRNNMEQTLPVIIEMKP